MWIKILTTINSLLILSFIAAGYFVHSEVIIYKSLQKTELEKQQNQIEVLTEMQQQLSENPVLKLDLTPGNSLQLSSNGPLGFVDLDGIVSLQPKVLPDSGDEVEVVIVGFKNPSDDSLIEYVQEKIAKKEAYFKEDNGRYFMPIGCILEDKMVDLKSKVSPETVRALGAEGAESAQLRVYYGTGQGYANECSSGVSDLKEL